MAHRKVPAPFVPKIQHELDVRNFATEFTNMVPADSLAIIPNNAERIFKVIIIIHNENYKLNVERCEQYRKCWL